MTDVVIAAIAIALLVALLAYVAFFLPAPQSARLAAIFGAPRWRVHGVALVGRESAPSLLVVDGLRGRGRGGREHTRVRIVSLADGAIAGERIVFAHTSSVEVLGSANGVAWIAGLDPDGPVALREPGLETAITGAAVRAADPSLTDGPVRVAFERPRGLAVLGRDGRWRVLGASGRASLLDGPPSETTDAAPATRALRWAERAPVASSGRTVALPGAPARQHVEGLDAPSSGATALPTYLDAALAIVPSSRGGSEALELRDPPSIVVRHRDRLGDAGRLRIARIATSPLTERWSVDVLATRAIDASGDALVAAFALDGDLVVIIEERRAPDASIAHVVRIDGARGTPRYARAL